MNRREPKKGGGGRLSRTETVTVRLDPKLRYIAEIAARVQRRTLSSYIEAALMEALVHESIRPEWLKSGLEVSAHTVGTEADYLWDVDEADRFVKLALRYPNLLTHDEQMLWKLIRESAFLWRVRGKGASENDGQPSMSTLKLDQLRQHWEALKAVAAGERKAVALPT